MKEITDINNKKVGWIGTGIMGGAMCENLISAGCSVFVYNRTRDKALPLLRSGAVWCESPAEVVGNAGVIFTMVGFPEDVREVYFGEDGIFETIRSGSIAVDMTTSEPSLAQEIYERAKKSGVASVDAPVSGGDTGAKQGTLSIMAGGDTDALERLMPYLRVIGSNIVYQGKAGAGQHAKMCNQITVAGNMIGLCETLLYCQRSGLDPETMIRSVGSGAASSWLLNNLGPRMIKEDYAPGFFVEHFIKDMSIALKESHKMNIRLPGLALVRDLYNKTVELGHGKSGTQALILALEHLSGEDN